MQNAYVSLPYSHAYGRSDKELQYLRIGDLLTNKAQTVGNNTAFVSEYENISKTFSQFNEDVNKLAKGLHDLGLRRGDVVGVWSCNSYSWIQVQYACAKLGIVLCTVNPVYQSPELNYALRKGQIKAIFMPGNGSKQEVVNKYQNVLKQTLSAKEEKESDPLILKDIIFMDGNYSSEDAKGGFNYMPITNLVANNGNVDQSIVDDVSPDDPAIIMFTSVVNNALLTGTQFGFDDPITMLIPLPFFHSFAAVLGNISMTAVPIKSVIANLKYDVKLIVESMIKHSATHIIVTPTMVIDILNFVEKNSLKLPALR
ncbi:unnamed protein product, partial [Medioppia subpectinata]